ncbi:uncharacterized protein CDV56_108632 [Aspergillus thermomutatus]|uniref:Uncharacterized protein n=1 Tax=Aspergillus thermomutatus TaxID=41047 RepID=A0A397HNS7_ASPTH|nr:uncharacterized protein CDV56_108632 [Aspergillus thermomutatus]RHZ63618.1 hypothetical protein CDV56_108632 [Aspergillus thermomutatus]
MATDADADSRHNVDLHTGSKSYDEAVAFTERIINKNFEQLFTLYPQMKKVKRTKYGQPTIDAVLHPSQIIIPTDSATYGTNTVLYQLRVPFSIIKKKEDSAQQVGAGIEGIGNMRSPDEAQPL